MLDTTNYAALAADVYETRKIGETITAGDKHRYKVLDIDDSTLGCHGILYQRLEKDDRPTDDITISYRGTTSLWDRITDVIMAISRFALEESDAEGFAHKTVHKYPEVTVTGHSLGGTLAEITAHKFGLSGETFNAYGAVGLNLQNTPADGTPVGGNSLIAHVRATDITSAANEHFGKVIVYATDADIKSLLAAGYSTALGGSGGNIIEILKDSNVLTSHGIKNFSPAAGNPNFILKPADLDIANANRGLIKNFRDDVYRVQHEVTSTSAMIGQALATQLKGLGSNGILSGISNVINDVIRGNYKEAIKDVLEGVILGLLKSVL